ncbi:WSCD family member AAEL009094 [Coccinella septempunctata]|uniref:WSCD family member AAEL009094 n=1 Tax=Coccinella septempunctata TaxID=41139 RepID=UPI001D08E7E6|nr:WSCD family member AAEL009094 [Coccinella septempunctata]XP_044763478.1 WSCD family member AAEL009094 [Coccinella septempunctata]XP_044763479.1 WSCD family member AAEL009094 [Coccinella septempunctata]XP_044763480.1 WSCD family member AAEL009094 [Coccinella septempunctata]
MHVNRFRFWIFSFLLFLYLAGVFIISAITLQDSKNKSVKPKPSYLQESKFKHYDLGFSGFRPPLPKSKINWCTDLKYLQPAKPLVALASFPGSGNTWVRYLLQQATGILTGSVYRDYSLLKNGFPAENVVNGSVLLVKTHEFGPNAKKIYSKAILLVRSPTSAIQAEFNRQSGGHVGFASPIRYKRNRGKYWEQFVYDKLQMWKLTNLDWLYNFTGPTHVIFYEQLVDNLENNLRSMLNFLEVPISEELFKCALERREGIYRRKKRAIVFDPYSSKMKEKIKEEQQKVYEAIYNFASPTKR